MIDPKLKTLLCVVKEGSYTKAAELLALSQQQAIIPMNPRCESLNAAVAATIVLWQMRGMR